MAVLLIHVLVALRLDARVPTDGEARFAAAVFAVRGGPIGAVGLPLPEQFAARQFAAVAALVAPGAASVWDTVRVVGLVLGVVTAVLLWALLQRFGCGSVATALAVAIVGITPAAVALHAGATAASVAVPWLLLAGLLCWRGRVLGVAAAGAALLAVLTLPLIGAVLLALAAHWVVERTVSRTVRASRGVPAAVALGAAAIALAVASAGSGPLAGQAAPMITTRAALIGAVCGLVAVAAGCRVRWTRPLLSPALLVLAVLLVPGPGRAAAALTAFALLAAVTAAAADDLPAWVPVRVRPGLAAVVAAAAAVAAVLALPALRAAPATDRPPATLLAWAGEQQMSGAMLHADPLDRAELVVAGFPPDRLRDLGAPVADVDVVLLADRPQAGRPTGAPVHCAAGTLLATVPSWAGAPAEICGARPPVADPDPGERASRVRIGTALVGNPGLTLTPAAAALLRQGAVDPRIMIVLAALTGSHSLAVTDFPLPALDPSGSVRQQVLLSAVDGAPVAGGVPSFLGDWLGGQHAPYAPAVVRGDGSGLLIGYRDAPPAGLLPAG